MEAQLANEHFAWNGNIYDARAARILSVILYEKSPRAINRYVVAVSDDKAKYWITMNSAELKSSVFLR